jgi:hypothetical protein
MSIKIHLLLGNASKLEIGGKNMTKQTILTSEEAEAIEWVKQQIQYKDHPSVFVEAHLKHGGWLGEAEVLTGMHPDTLIRALYVGYEIEQPKFEAEDWVTRTRGKDTIGHHFSEGRTFKVIEAAKNGVTVSDENKWYHSTSDIRLATKKEILWAELGREIGEFVKGDVVIENDNMTHLIGEYKEELADDLEFAKNYFTKELLKGFYPAESFIKFPK